MMPHPHHSCHAQLVCSLVSRTGGFRRAFPVVEDLHQAQISMLTPLLQGGSFWGAL